LGKEHGNLTSTRRERTGADCIRPCLFRVSVGRRETDYSEKGDRAKKVRREI
jgi:hypothetical protein